MQQHDQRGQHQELVGNRINEFAEIGDQIVFAGDKPVEKIGKRRDDEQRAGNDAAGIRLLVKQDHNDRDQRHPDDAQFVWQVHSIFPLRS